MKIIFPAGWVGEWVGGLVDGWVVCWVDGWVNCKDGYMDRFLLGQ